MSISTYLTAPERDILNVLGIDIFDDADVQRLVGLRSEHPIIVAKVTAWQIRRKQFIENLEANPLGDFYSLSK